jgi:hypothetical protein
MAKIDLVYDGKAFQPVTPVSLPIGARLTAEWDEKATQRESAWDILRRLAGTAEMPEDWSEEHDHYLYGTPKRGGAEKSDDCEEREGA